MENSAKTVDKETSNNYTVCREPTTDKQLFEKEKLIKKMQKETINNLNKLKDTQD